MNNIQFVIPTKEESHTAITKKQEKIKMNNIQFVFPTKEESHKAIHKKIM